jgi:hypothetical protein
VERLDQIGAFMRIAAIDSRHAGEPVPSLP